MKTIKFSLLISFLLISKSSYCDMIPANSHYVEKCVKITNLSDYTDISLLGFVTGPTGLIPTYLISSNECLKKGYKFNSLNIFAVQKSYLANIYITTINWTKDKNAIKSSVKIDCYGEYLNDSIHISAINQYYRIIGFTDTSVVIYKFKEVNKFNNGKQDSIKTYVYTGDSTILSQKITTKVKTIQNKSSIELFPNPSQKNLHLKISNSYRGSVTLKMHSIDGKTVRSLIFKKTETFIDYIVNVENISKDIYLVDIIMGTTVEVKKITIK